MNFVFCGPIQLLFFLLLIRCFCYCWIPKTHQEYNIWKWLQNFIVYAFAYIMYFVRFKNNIADVAKINSFSSTGSLINIDLNYFVILYYVLKRRSEMLEVIKKKFNRTKRCLVIPFNLMFREKKVFSISEKRTLSLMINAKLYWEKKFAFVASTFESTYSSSKKCNRFCFSLKRNDFDFCYLFWHLTLFFSL